MSNVNIQLDSELIRTAQTWSTQFGVDLPTAIVLMLRHVSAMQSHIRTPTPTPKPGAWSGKIWMADDFDAPLDDFAEYM